MNDDYILLQNFLQEFFNYAESYTTDIKDARQKIAQEKAYADDWMRISLLIRNRDLLPGQPLNFIHYDANQVLDENTDEEAYVWLDQMVYNIGKSGQNVEEY